MLLLNTHLMECILGGAVNLVKQILKETVSDQAMEIATWSPYAFRRGLTMASNDYSGEVPDVGDSPEIQNELNVGDAMHELAQLHTRVADHYESAGRAGAARWHRSIASRLVK